MAGKLIKLFDESDMWARPYTTLRMPRTGEFSAMAAMAWGYNNNSKYLTWVACNNNWSTGQFLQQGPTEKKRYKTSM